MKKLLLSLLALCLVLAMAGCSKKEEPKTEKTPLEAQLLTSGKIIVGTSPDYPPFESLNASGEIEGFEVDLLQLVINELNAQQGTSLEAELKQLDFNMIIGALDASQIDIGMSGFTYSPDRDCAFATPHLVSRQVIITREGTGITCGEDLIGKNVAAGNGTTGAAAVGEIIGMDNIKYPGDYTVEFQALQAGQLDAVVCDEAVGDNYVKEMGLIKCEEPLVNEDMSLIIKKSNNEILAAFNAAIEAVVAGDEYAALVEKYGL